MVWLIIFLWLPQDPAPTSELDPTAVKYVELAMQAQQLELAELQARVDELKSQSIDGSKERKVVRAEQKSLEQRIRKIRAATPPPANLNVHALQAGQVGKLVTPGFRKGTAAAPIPVLEVWKIIDDTTFAGRVGEQTFLVKGIDMTDPDAETTLPLTDVFVIEAAEGDEATIDDVPITFVLRKFTAEADIPQAWENAKRAAKR